MTKLIYGRAPPRTKRGPSGGLAENNIDNSNAAEHSLIKLREQATRRQRRQRITELVWKLGARAFFEFVEELDFHHDTPDLDQGLERFANADPRLVAFFGRDRFPAGPARILRNGPWSVLDGGGAP